jgi:hypothetical protein
MIWKLLLFVAISGVLHIAVKVFGRVVPKENPVPTGDWPPEMLAAVAKRANFWGTLGALVLFLLIFPAWIAGAWWLDYLTWPKVQPGEMLTVSLQLWRLARAGVAAWILAGAIALVIFKLIARWRYDLFMAAGNEQFGFKASGFFIWWLIWVLPFCVEFELHAIGNSAYFSMDSLAIRDSMLWPPEQHPYKDLASIELAQPFNVNRAEIGRPPECRLTFKDDFVFTDVPWIIPFDDEGKRTSWEAACELASTGSGLPIQIKPKIE